MPQPLAEVFGFPPGNFSRDAERYRRLRLCPYNNKVPNCTKDKAKAPLGVCSVLENTHAVATCPVRFRQGWLIAEHAAGFFFPAGTNWTSLTEVRLPDKVGRSAGNIDVVLVAYDRQGRVTDFGALEVQAVYISGNIRNAFEHYLEDPHARHNLNWAGANYPRPDYLSSSRKRLAPQLIYKGGILKNWEKKTAVAVDESFFNSLPDLPESDPAQAEIAWLVYALELDPEQNRYNLNLVRTVYTAFTPALVTLTTTEAGPLDDFLEQLQHKLDEKLETGSAPEAPALGDILSQD